MPLRSHLRKLESAEDAAGRGRGGRCRGRRRGRGGKSSIEEKPPPLPLCVRIVEQIEAKFPMGIKLAHDGKTSVFASKDPGFTETVYDVELDDNKYKVHLTRVNKISLNKETLICPKEILQVLEIIYRTSLFRKWLYDGRNFSIKRELDNESVKIGGGARRGCLSNIHSK